MTVKTHITHEILQHFIKLMLWFQSICQLWSHKSVLINETTFFHPLLPCHWFSRAILSKACKLRGGVQSIDFTLTARLKLATEPSGRVNCKGLVSFRGATYIIRSKKNLWADAGWCTFLTVRVWNTAEFRLDDPYRLWAPSENDSVSGDLSGRSKRFCPMTLLRCQNTSPGMVNIQQRDKKRQKTNFKKLIF